VSDSAGGVLVALETSGPVGSVAVARSGDVVARAFLTSQWGHATDLLPALEKSLDEAGVPRSGIEGVVVGAGPGSFTGVRVAVAMAKGLAHGLGVPLWAPSSLEAAAVGDSVLPRGTGPWSVPPDLLLEDGGRVVGQVRYVLFDARSDRVYAACYRVHDDGVETLRDPRATRIAEVLERPLPEEVRFVGTGAVKHRDRIVREGRIVLPPPAGMPTADGLIRVLSLTRDDQPVEDPWSWEPDYLRDSSAERAGFV
jgi:tRNA threonylcarbamoyladenosine biosynthesis protein TsaB